MIPQDPTNHPTDKPVYTALAEHQRSEDWELRDLLAELRRWERLFNDEFKLELPVLSIGADYIPRRRLGHFRRGHNGFGLWGEVIINRRHLDRPFWRVLGTLLHEMLHAWQELHGSPAKRSYHNAEFRSKASWYGLCVDTRGCTQYTLPSRFTDLLARHGIHVPPQPAPVVRESLRGSSKLKKWSCGCTNVRVAVADFQARCLKCGNLFALED